MGSGGDASAPRVEDAAELAAALEHAGAGLQEQIGVDGVDLAVLHRPDSGETRPRANGAEIDVLPHTSSR